MGALVAGPLSPADAAIRAAARARGSDRPTAVAIGRVLLARPLPAQLTQIRCERTGQHQICGLVLSGVKFKHPLNRRGFIAEVRALIGGAFATAPIEEVDLWTTVPLGTGKGIVVSGDLAVATAATVFAVTVPRSRLGQLDRQLASGADLFWDASFAHSLSEGTSP